MEAALQVLTFTEPTFRPGTGAVILDTLGPVRC